MSERLEPILKLSCLLLAVLVLYQVLPLIAARDPLADRTAPLLATAEARSQPQTGPGKPEIPPMVAARIERITQSEIFGPIQRPLPMGLIGIFGNEASLRTPHGQVGWLKEGEELGGVKLVRIGTNRILVEHEGQLKELTIFGGLGGESLQEQENAK
jgi:hypothetical protein